MATLWVGSPTKVRQCWKLIAQESLCHLAVLNLWRDLIVQNSVLILVYKHSCWVHSLCQQYACIVIENYPVGSCMHCKQCSCRCCFTLIIRQWTMCCSSCTLRSCGGHLKCCSGVHQEENVFLLHLSSKVFNKGQFMHILVLLGKKTRQCSLSGNT